MNRNLTFLGIVVLTMFLVGGCSLNTISKEKIVSTGLFGGNLAKMDAGFNQLKSGMTKEEVVKLGFNFNAKNVQCLKGPDAMSYVIGDARNNADLSTAEKIEAYAKATNAYEACVFPEQRLKSEKARFFFSSRQEKERGPEIAYIITFKNGLLFNSRNTRRNKDITEKEKAFGGNVLDAAIGAGISAGKKLW